MFVSVYSCVGPCLVSVCVSVMCVSVCIPLYEWGCFFCVCVLFSFFAYWDIQGGKNDSETHLPIIFFIA